MSNVEALRQRSNEKCELCAQSNELGVFMVHPPKEDLGDGGYAYICSECQRQINEEKELDENHWRCLNDSMWSEFPGVKVLAWRMLKKLSDKGWARDLLDQFYMEDDLVLWTKEGLPEGSGTSVVVKDSNGTPLQEGDTVTLIKDLDVKGANFTAKRGTVVRKIRLTDNPEHIEGKVNGQQIVLVAKFLKKA